MTVDIAAKNILVTGGARGIGRAVVLALAGAGANVVTCYRQESEATVSLIGELKNTTGQHHVVRADVRDPGQIGELVAVCREQFGSLDAVVNNAGVISHVPYEELGLDEWHRIVDTNLTGAFLVTQKALPLLGSGSSVVHIGSRVSTVGIPQRAHYTAAKAGMVGLARSQAKELGSRGIRVNVVEPGVIETEEAAKLPPEAYEKLQARYRAMTALGRLGDPAEIGKVVVFLVSDLASYVTGATIAVDGGI